MPVSSHQGTVKIIMEDYISHYPLSSSTMRSTNTYFFGNISTIADATVFGVLITFFLVNLSLIVLRKKKPELERPFKLKPNIKGLPIVALLGCIACFGLLFSFADSNGLLTIIIQGIIVICGVIVFYAMKLLRKKS